MDSYLIKYTGNCEKCDTEEFILNQLEYYSCIELFEGEIKKSDFINKVENLLKIHVVTFEVKLSLDDKFEFLERLNHDRIILHKLQILWKLKVCSVLIFG